MHVENVVIDIKALKNKHDKDSLQYYIWSIALNCKKSSRAFWSLEKTLRCKEKFISFPLLILSSATGLTSVSLQQSFSTPIANILVALGVSSACLVAIQKFTKYGERAEMAKHVAKSYSRIARRIETTMVLVESSAVHMDPNEFLKFICDIEKELDTILNDTHEVPGILMQDIKSNRTVENGNEMRQQGESVRDVERQVHAMFRKAIPPPPPSPPPHCSV